MQPTPTAPSPAPARLRLWDMTSLVVGIIIGVGIYRTPATVFDNTGAAWQALLLWVIGGLLSLIGALCFAELASTYPRSGGEYVYLTRAYGRPAGFLFGWAQLAIIRAGGSIGPVAFIFAQYAAVLAHQSVEDPWFPCVVASSVVAFLTVINILGVRTGALTQNALTALKVVGIGAILVAGFAFGRLVSGPPDTLTYTGWLVSREPGTLVIQPAGGDELTFAVGRGVKVVVDGSEQDKDRRPLTVADLKEGVRVKVLANRDAPATALAIRAYSGTVLSNLAFGLILVLWTYAGWHEAAYVVAEVRDKRRTIALALLLGTGAVVVLYLAVNLAYLAGLGFEAAGAADRIAANVLGLAFPEWGDVVMSVLVILSCLGALNGMIFTSARIYVEMGADHPLFGPLARWDRRFGTPAISLTVQGVLTIAFIVFVSFTFPRDDGFDALVKCTAAVFWLLFLLTGIGLFVLREKDPNVHRPYPVPLYPLTPILFCVSCVAMVYASIEWAGWLTLVGLGVLVVGVPLYVLSEWMRKYNVSRDTSVLVLTEKR